MKEVLVRARHRYLRWFDRWGQNSANSNTNNFLRELIVVRPLASSDQIILVTRLLHC